MKKPNIFTSDHTLQQFHQIVSAHQHLNGQEFPNGTLARNFSIEEGESNVLGSSLYASTQGLNGISTSFDRDANAIVGDLFYIRGTIPQDPESKYALSARSFKQAGQILQANYRDQYRYLLKNITPDKLNAIIQCTQMQLSLLKQHSFSADNNAPTIAHLDSFQRIVGSACRVIVPKYESVKSTDIAKDIEKLSNACSNISEAVGENIQLLRSASPWNPPVDIDRFPHLEQKYQDAVRAAMALRVFCELAPNLMEQTLSLFVRRVHPVIDQWSTIWQEQGQEFINQNETSMAVYGFKS